MADLKACPCGKVPAHLSVSSPEGDRPKWARVSGDCCGEWEIEYRNQYEQLGMPASQDRATAAWNRAPRAGDDHG